MLRNSTLMCRADVQGSRSVHRLKVSTQLDLFMVFLKQSSPCITGQRKLVVICSKLISAVSHIDCIAKRSRTRIRTWLIDVLTEHNTTICTVQQLDFQHLVGILRTVSHFCQFMNSLYGTYLAVSLAACLILERVLRRFELPILSSHVPHSDRGQLFAWDLKVHLFF